MPQKKTLTLNKSKNAPGKLRGNYAITLHTRQAQRLFLGRRKTDAKPAIIGLTAFSSMIAHVWNAAAKDDPYADWILIQAEEGIEEAQRQVHARRNEIDARLQSRERLQIEVASSLKPVEMPLSFPTPYGYMGAYLIDDFDQLVLRLLTAVHVALIPRDTAMAILSQTGRTIRRTFLTPTHYKHLGITRKDLEMMTQRGAEAVKLMGELPPEVLAGTRRSRHAPPIKAPAAPDAPGIDLLDDEDDDPDADESPVRLVSVEAANRKKASP